MAGETARRPLTSRPLDFFYVLFFAVHLVASCLIDSQVFLPAHFIPAPLSAVLDTFLRDTNDPLMRSALEGRRDNAWFLAALVGEMVIQLPIFALGILALLKDDKRIYPVLILYASVAGITTAQVLATYFVGDERFLLTSHNIVALLQAHALWAITPPILLVDMTARCIGIIGKATGHASEQQQQSRQNPKTKDRKKQ